MPDITTHSLRLGTHTVQGSPVNASFCSAVTSNDPTPHQIHLTGQPTYQRFRPLFGAKLSSARTQIHTMLNQGIIRRSNSPYASPIVMVLKKDKSYRICGDYRLLNQHTIPDKYPLPRIHDVIHSLHGASHFSLLDIEKAYHHIPMHPNDVCRTAINTPLGLFEYIKMPFGLKNAASSFQQYMDGLFHIEGVFV